MVDRTAAEAAKALAIHSVTGSAWDGTLRKLCFPRLFRVSKQSFEKAHSQAQPVNELIWCGFGYEQPRSRALPERDCDDSDSVPTASNLAVHTSPLIVSHRSIGYVPTAEY